MYFPGLSFGSSNAIPWYSPYTSPIADLPDSWAGALAYGGAFSLALPPMGVLGVPVLSFFSGVDWGLIRPAVNYFGSSMFYRPGATAAARPPQSPYGQEGPKWRNDYAGNVGEGAGEVEEGEQPETAGEEQPGTERTRNLTQLSDPKYGAWSAEEIEKAKAVQQAARGKGGDKFTVGVTFGPNRRQVTLSARPKKGDTPTSDDTKKIRAALNRVKANEGKDLEVAVVVGGRAIASTTAGSWEANCDADIEKRNAQAPPMPDGRKAYAIKRSEKTISVDVTEPIEEENAKNAAKTIAKQYAADGVTCDSSCQ